MVNPSVQQQIIKETTVEVIAVTGMPETRGVVEGVVGAI